MPLAFQIKQKTILGDAFTPVQMYLKLRDKYPGALLLESSDYHHPAKSLSFICLNPISTFLVDKGEVTETYADGTENTYPLKGLELADKFKEFTLSFQVSGAENLPCNGLFGYSAWDSIVHFETIEFKSKNNPATLPEFRYSLYQNVVVFNHSNNQIRFVEFQNNFNQSQFEAIQTHLLDRNFLHYPFQRKGEIRSNLTDDQFREMVSLGKKACFVGDVFQIVPSRQFAQDYLGDDFQVYRMLRSINPSPYLFYYDYGRYRIFGSSPEAQLIIKDQIAQIDPIAGTVRRTGDEAKDKLLTQGLLEDPKENAEHVMLVDLARNDLSRNSDQVYVESYKEVQVFSHVIHLVSKVKAQLEDGVNSHKVFADTFPAGTLSGAPKFKALELIDQMENQNRGMYGGAIGFVGFDGDINTAIAIRTFVSKENTLYFQAGAGVVAKSIEENELQEVNHKLGALRKAIEMADELQKENDR
ncbi:MAG: anthranilate synthase component I [Flavobacteriaceae bacterium]|nr:MAG: anthranilate synthase component I [Flavobacteriaceae bacterium]